MINLVEYSSDFIEKIKAFKADWNKAYDDISKTETPEYDGTGIKIIDKRLDGKDYIIESYMRQQLTKHFPGWSWEMAAPLHFLGSEWVVAQGNLCIVDEHLLALGINPPVRKFYGVDSVRIQYGRDKPHVPENIVDVGDNCKSANSSALKYAINRLCNIGDDVYGKRLESEGSGSIIDILETNKEGTFAQSLFMGLLSKKHILPSKAMGLLGIANWSEITDWHEAYLKIQEVK